MAKSIKNKKHSMKKYIANISQDSQTSNLSTTEFENTFSGAFTWVRQSAGFYKASLINEFTDGGVYLPPFGNYGGDATIWLPIAATAGNIIGYYTLFIVNEDEVGIFVEDASGSRIDLFDLIGSTDLSLPEIRVYP
jgi:hypothetical protein